MIELDYSGIIQALREFCKILQDCFWQSLNNNINLKETLNEHNERIKYSKNRVKILVLDKFKIESN